MRSKFKSKKKFKKNFKKKFSKGNSYDKANSYSKDSPSGGKANWMQGAVESIKNRGMGGAPTGDKFGGQPYSEDNEKPTFAKTFKKFAKKKRGRF